MCWHLASPAVPRRGPPCACAPWNVFRQPLNEERFMSQPSFNTFPHRLRIALRALHAGRPILLFDDDERENEADLIVAAEHITPETMALFIREGSGIVCLCLPPD